MKKTIAMLLAGMFTVSCGIVSASAADIGDSLEDMQMAPITYSDINNLDHIYQDVQ